jgi:hypothetical protein
MRKLPPLVSSGLACAAAVLAAQVSAQNPPQFRAGVDVIGWDVSVYDKDHHPIKGLKASDFTLFEDKLVRPLAGFSEVNIPDPPPVTATWMRDVTGDVAENNVADKRLFLIVIDDQSFGKDLMFKRVRDEVSYAARAVINRLGPSDLAAVVFGGDNRHEVAGRGRQSVRRHHADGLPARQRDPHRRRESCRTGIRCGVEAGLGVSDGGPRQEKGDHRHHGL